MDLLDPQDFTIKDGAGNERTYILSKFPAIAGREIIAKYPTSALPKLGDYAVSEETMLKLMKYVAINIEGRIMRFESRDFIDQHVPDWETLAKIEMAMMEKNCSFFRDGRVSAFLADAVQTVLASLSEILSKTSAVSSTQEKPPSTN